MTHVALVDDARRKELGAADLARAAMFTWTRAADALAGAYRQALAS